MAAPAKFQPISEHSLESTPQPLDAVMAKAAELYGLGHARKEIARLLVHHLDRTPERPMEAKIKYARAKLRRWERTQEFRDMVWDRAVIDLDMSTPEILRGVARKAKRGRVDAAKLVLGITGRYREKSSDTPGAVTINIAHIPRPAVQAVDPDGSKLRLEVDADG